LTRGFAGFFGDYFVRDLFDWRCEFFFSRDINKRETTAMTMISRCAELR
jgi:hypothetical protein